MFARRVISPVIVAFSVTVKETLVLGVDELVELLLVLLDSSESISKPTRISPVIVRVLERIAIVVLSVERRVP